MVYARGRRESVSDRSEDREKSRRGPCPSVPRSERLAPPNKPRNPHLEAMRAVHLPASVPRAPRHRVLLLVHIEAPRAAARRALVAAAAHVAVVRRLQGAEVVRKRVAAVALARVLRRGDAEALGGAGGDALRGRHVGVGEGVAGERARGAVEGAAGGDPVAGTCSTGGGGSGGRSSGGGGDGKDVGGGRNRSGGLDRLRGG